jgi:hypothetical protein
MQPQFSSPPVKWAPPQTPVVSDEVPLRIDDKGEPVYSDWVDRPSSTETPQPDPGEAIIPAPVVQATSEQVEPAPLGEPVDVEVVSEEIKPVKIPRKRAPKKAVAKKSASAELAHVDDVSDEQLMADYGVEQIFSTTDAAEFFDRTNQWLYWGLREGVFTHDDGTPVDPDRIGDPEKGRRRFTLPIIKDILLSSYRRGNVEPDELKTILRRVRIAELGGEWREKEGWKQVELGKRKIRWVKPERVYFDDGEQRYKLRPEFQVKKDGEIVAAKAGN